jgi:hypothetical protein
MYCTRCGTRNVDEAKFCSKCGAPVSGDASSAAPHAHAAPAARAPAAAPGTAPSAARADAGAVLPTVPIGKITDLRTARAAALMGVVAAVGAIVFAIVAVARGIGPIGYVTVAIFAAIGIGIWRMSRAAAVCGLVLALANLVALFPLTNGHPEGPALWIILGLALFFYFSIRGTFAHHRLLRTSPATV